jgi:hypothetical protein
MDDPGLVGPGQALGDRDGEAESLARVERAVGQALAERLALSSIS